MFYDDLPIWGFIGKTEKLMKPGEKPLLRFYLFTHIHFDILYNDNRVIEVNVSTDPARTVDITNGDKIIVDYTYSVNWREGTTPYEKRMEKYSRYSFLPQHLEVRPPRAAPEECLCLLTLTLFKICKMVHQSKERSASADCFKKHNCTGALRLRRRGTDIMPCVKMCECMQQIPASLEVGTGNCM